MRRAVAVLALVGIAPLAACAPGGEEKASRDATLIETDPVIARALHDPLMSDPDLASRNEANAAIGFVDSSALPVLAANPEETDRTREAMRIALLESGPLPDLPPAGPAVTGRALGPASAPGELLAAVGAPAVCAKGLREDFALAASLPSPAALPPRAMVVQAGGSDAPGCALRIVRYLTAAQGEDVLQYHYVTARRAGLTPARHAAPAEGIAASGKDGQRLAVHLRDAAHGLTGVTLVYRGDLAAMPRAAARP